MTFISTVGQAMPLSSGNGPATVAANKGLQQASNAVPNVAGSDPHAQVNASMLSLVEQFAQLLSQLSQGGGKQGSMASSGAAVPAMPPAGASSPAAPPAGPSQSGDPQAGAAPAAGHSPAAPGTSAGAGPNAVNITNNEDHAITAGKFKNGDSTTEPSAKITLQPHQSGTLRYENGESGYAAQADAGGKFQPNASRLEYEADKDGKMKYPNVSYIDGRNASIALTDGAGLNKGDSKSIAGSANPGIVTTDSANNKTVTGWYDGSTAQMQAGGAFMQSQLGTSGAYLHPDDDKLSKGQNPMSGTQSSTTNASFGNT